jgi:selenocysteine lyase/cysteine desulfurase
MHCSLPVADCLQAVEAHTQALSAWLYSQLSNLKHSNGTPLLQLYGKHAQQQQQQQGAGQLVQGSIFNFTVLQPDGSPVSYSRVEGEAAAAAIDLRSGCVCNPGGVCSVRCLTWIRCRALCRCLQQHFEPQSPYNSCASVTIPMVTQHCYAHPGRPCLG